MEDVFWKDLDGWNKFIFCLGWLGVINPIFWIFMLIKYKGSYHKKFFNPISLKVVLVFGIIHLIISIFVIGIIFWLTLSFFGSYFALKYFKFLTWIIS